MSTNLETPAKLKKKAIVFRPFDESIDFEWYYRLSTKINSLINWRFYGSPPTREQFAQLMYVAVHCQFVAELSSVSSNKDPRIGVVVSYNYDAQNNTTFLGTITSGNTNGLGVIISIIFIEYLFNTWPIRKIYLEMPEFNTKSIKSAINRFLIEESRLKDHCFSYNRYWDYLTFALYRQDFYDNCLATNILNRFRRVDNV